MSSTEYSRRSFLATAVAATVHHVHGAQIVSPVQNADVQGLLDKWDSAWADHNPQAIAALLAEDAVKVGGFVQVGFSVSSSARGVERELTRFAGIS